jgi:phosphohistidine phosphatase
MVSSGSVRTLLLLRHAKSSWDNPGADDFERPLAPRGRRVAPLVGAEMVRRGWLPERVLCSPARRTRETWELASAALGPVPASFEPGLYLAAPAALLRLVRATPPEVGRLLLIGHNPGLQELGLLLADPRSGEDLVRLRAKLPTAGLVVLSLPDGPWSAVAAGNLRLEAFVAPRDLE